MKKCMNKWKTFGSDNRGSALITVMVFVAFITVLATILLYITGVNFQIKQNDYRNKKNFYTAETALEEIKYHLMEYSSQAAVTAYDRTMKDYVRLGTGAARQAEFCQFYSEELIKKLDDAQSGAGGWQALLTSYISDTTHSTLEIEVDPALVLDDSKKLEGSLRLKGIKLTYINEDGYAAIITTDLKLEAPDLGWEDYTETMQAYQLKNPDRTVDMDNPEGVTFAKQSTDVVDVSKCVDYINWVKR